MNFKSLLSVLLSGILCLSLVACQKEETATYENATTITLSDEAVEVEGNKEAVHTANDIIYYEEGHDFTYGEGTKEDEHSRAEAQEHTVVHITEPGEYVLTGTLSKGQVAVDLGDDAKEDPNAVVTLILNDVDITCTVAPAVIFYNVYECSSADTESASETVDTSAAGANVIIADDSVNNINGSYVARIYDPSEEIVLNEAGTEVEDAKKLHKYDAAFYSKRTMNASSEKTGNGILNITAENEGLDSELHLTLNGGTINIKSGNDGINTNEDGVSVTTINGGNVNIMVTGETGEGDGIDSNGWLVINGGTVIAEACSTSGDAGIDSDMGIHVNGGTVIATGNMLDRLEDTAQNYAVFTFSEKQKAGATYTLKNSEETVIFEHTPQNDFSIMVVSGAELTEGDYMFWRDEVQLEGTSGMGGNMMGGGFEPDGEIPEGMEPGEHPEMPEGVEPGERPEMPEGMEPGERPEMPEGMEQGERPEMPGGMEPGEKPQRGDFANGVINGEMSITFRIVKGGNMYQIR